MIRGWPADVNFITMLANFTFDMGASTNFAKIFLSEAAKYIVFFLFAILAIRLWRRSVKVTAENRRGHFLMAGAATVIATAVGYFSYCHSMGRLYSYYGKRAFVSGYAASAAVLYSKSAQYWENADAIGKEGICLLWAGRPDLGIRLLDKANARKWKADGFGSYYEGLYHLYNGQTDKAVPLLQAASTDPIYHWSVVKLFATVQLDWNQPQEAEKLMAPFKNIPITEMDQAYVMASLELAEGKKAGAQALWKEFAATNLPPFWQARFDKLGAKIQIQNP